MVEFPRLPRRLTFTDFIEKWLSKLFVPFCGGLLPPMTVSLRLQLAGEGGAGYLLTINNKGQLVISQTSEGALMDASLDNEAYKALYDLLSQQYNALYRKNGLPAFCGKWQDRYKNVLGQLPRLSELAEKRPAIFLVSFIDELQQEHQLEVKLGQVDRKVAKMTVHCDLSNMAALNFSSFKFTGDDDYFAKIAMIFG